MSVTLKDLIISGTLSDFKLIAGKNGLSKKISHCAILDYEFDNDLNIYNSKNFFKENQLILTSFMYAKNNEFVIFDALKKLIECNVCGIVINNIYNIPINDMILKIADSKNFPIFMSKNTNIRFENIILSINKFIENIKSTVYYQNIIDNILNNNLEDATNLYPNMKPLYVCLYIKFDKNNDISQINSDLHNYIHSLNVNHIDFTQYIYKHGILFLFSFEAINGNTYIKAIKDMFNNYNNQCHIGISNTYDSIKNISCSIRESIYSAAYACYFNIKKAEYNNLGIYTILFDNCFDEKFTEYSNKIITPIETQDSVSGKLKETLFEFIKHRGNIHTLAQTTNQHINTIRNRLEKIKQITGLDFKDPDHYEQLALSVKICICRDMLNH